MTDAPADLSLLTGRDLKRVGSLAPGGQNFPAIVRRFAPYVFGVARKLIPENEEAAGPVAAAVFETLARRWRRISRKTFLVAWLLRTTIFAAGRERERLGLKVSRYPLFKKLLKLKPASQAALLLNTVFQLQPDVIAAAMRSRPARVGKWIAAAEDRLTRKTQLAARNELEGLPALLLDETTAAIADQFVGWKPAQKKSALVSSAIASWRWLKFFRIAKVGLAAIGGLILTLALLAMTLTYLWRQGYVLPWIIKNEQMKLAKEFPEMTLPARPFAASMDFPDSAARLYGLTNIWSATIRMTPEQWKAVQPKSIPPVKNFENGGKMKLRNPEASRSGLAGALGIDFHWSEGTFEFGGKTFEKVGVRFRGNGTYLNSLHGNKRSYKVDLNRNIKGQDIAAINTLNFVNALPDFSYMRDALGQKIFRELGAVAPRTAYAYLTIDVSGQFTNQALGLYVMIEDIGSDFAKDRLGSKAAPIFKPVDYDLFGDWGDDWKAYAEIYDLKTRATPEQTARVIEFAKLVSHAEDEEFAKRLPEFLDLEEYAAFVAGHVLLSSYDGYLQNGQNFYLYLDPRSNKFGFIPWDQDHGWGEFGYVGTAEKRENASIWHPAAYDNRFLKRVMKVDAFKKVYRAKLEQALAGPFTIEKVYREIDELAAIIRPAVAAESDFRLKRFEIAISTNWVPGPRNAPDMAHMEGPRAPAHQMKRFVAARIQSVREQLDGKHDGDRMHR